MAKLIYDAFVSLDGYVADADGNFDWGGLSDEVQAFINNRESRIGTYLFGRRMYETMALWEAPESIPGLTPLAMEYSATWESARKIVYSSTLPAVTTANTRLERRFDPGVISELKAHSARDIAIGGPGLASHAIRAGLVDEYDLLIAPVTAGGGNPYWPRGVRLQLEHVDECRFDNGVVHLSYRPKR